jgi:dienelactone hydrolase
MGNKYGDLGRMLFETGAACAMVETSRRRRDRDTFGIDREAWAHAAFDGKTFTQDLEDAIAGTEAVCREAGAHNVWVFGFSLGGIHAILAAGEESGFSFTPAGIALGGTGSGIRPEAATSLTLPILDTAPPKERLLGAADRITRGRFVSFFGSLDATFSEASCRELFERVAVPPERKNFIVIEGSDHPFRAIKGAETTKPIEMITMALSQIIF